MSPRHATTTTTTTSTTSTTTTTRYVWLNASVPNQLPFLSEPGTYDVWAIRYGYGIVDSDEELKSIADEENRAYAFCTDDDLRGGFAEFSDPSCSTRDLSNDTTLFFTEYAAVVEELKRSAFTDEFLTLKGNVASVTGNLLYVLRTLADGAALVAKHMGGSLVEKVEKHGTGDKVFAVDARTQRAAAAFVLDVLVSDEILYPPREHAAKYLSVGTLERSWVNGGYLGLESSPINIVTFARGLKSQLIDSVFAVERLSRMQHDEWAGAGSSLGLFLGEEKAFGIVEMFQAFNRGVIGDLANVRVPFVAGDEAMGGLGGGSSDRPSPYSCPTETLEGIEDIVAALDRMTTERLYVMTLWVKKLMEIAGPGLNVHSVVDLASGGAYRSDTSYASAAIGTLDMLSMQIECVLLSTQIEMKSYNDFGAVPMYQHMKVLHSEIARGWWRRRGSGAE